MVDGNVPFMAEDGKLHNDIDERTGIFAIQHERGQMQSIQVTGGVCLIGSNFVPYFAAKYPDCHIVNLDKLICAGNLEKLKECESMVNYTFVKGDICDEALVQMLFRQHDIPCVIHFAVESYIDNSIKGRKYMIRY